MDNFMCFLVLSILLSTVSSAPYSGGIKGQRKFNKNLFLDPRDQQRQFERSTALPITNGPLQEYTPDENDKQISQTHTQEEEDHITEAVNEPRPLLVIESHSVDEDKEIHLQDTQGYNRQQFTNQSIPDVAQYHVQQRNNNNYQKTDHGISKDIIEDNKKISAEDEQKKTYQDDQQKNEDKDDQKTDENPDDFQKNDQVTVRISSQGSDDNDQKYNNKYNQKPSEQDDQKKLEESEYQKTNQDDHQRTDHGILQGAYKDDEQKTDKNDQQRTDHGIPQDTNKDDQQKTDKNDQQRTDRGIPQGTYKDDEEKTDTKYQQRTDHSIPQGTYDDDDQKTNKNDQQRTKQNDQYAPGKEHQEYQKTTEYNYQKTDLDNKTDFEYDHPQHHQTVTVIPQSEDDNGQTKEHQKPEDTYLLQVPEIIATDYLMMEDDHQEQKLVTMTDYASQESEDEEQHASREDQGEGFSEVRSYDVLPGMLPKENSEQDQQLHDTSYNVPLSDEDTNSPNFDQDQQFYETSYNVTPSDEDTKSPSEKEISRVLQPPAADQHHEISNFSSPAPVASQTEVPVKTVNGRYTFDWLKIAKKYVFGEFR